MSRPLKNLEWLGQRDEAEHVPCPECEQPAGQTCINLDGGGEPGRLPVHWRRIRKAEET